MGGGGVFKSRVVRTAFAVLGALVLTASSTILMGSKSKDDYVWPAAEGTFIQPHLVKDWDDSKWTSELGYLKEAGTHYVILSATGEKTGDGMVRTIYPSGFAGFSINDGYSDVVDACLRNAEEMGFKVFLGLNCDSRWWGKYADDPEWLYNSMEDGNKIAIEIYAKYHDKYPHAFHGWYWTWEVDNAHFRKPAEQQVLATAININLDYLESNGIRLPVMMSPFMNYRYGSAKEYGNMWANIFKMTRLKKGDIFCPQDSVGAGGLDAAMVRQWFAELCKVVTSKPGLSLWANIETFDRDISNSSTIDRFIEQMKNVQPFVDNIVTFGYSHYYSPNVTAPGFHSSYLYYLKNGQVYKTEPKDPQEMKITKLRNGSVRIAWQAPESVPDICEYIIYRNGTIIKRVQVERGKGRDEEAVKASYYVDSSEGRSISAKYEAAVYDFSGNILYKAYSYKR